MAEVLRVTKVVPSDKMRPLGAGSDTVLRDGFLGEEVKSWSSRRIRAVTAMRRNRCQ